MISSLGAEAVERAEAITRQADVIAALTLETLKGTNKAFDIGESESVIYLLSGNYYFYYNIMHFYFLLTTLCNCLVTLTYVCVCVCVNVPLESFSQCLLVDSVVPRKVKLKTVCEKQVCIAVKKEIQASCYVVGEKNLFL